LEPPFPHSSQPILASVNDSTPTQMKFNAKYPSFSAKWFRKGDLRREEKHWMGVEREQQKLSRSIYSPDDVFPLPRGVRARKSSIWGGGAGEGSRAGSAATAAVRTRHSYSKRSASAMEPHFYAFFVQSAWNERVIARSMLGDLHQKKKKRYGAKLKQQLLVFSKVSPHGQQA
jgi:hypothetical protein